MSRRRITVDGNEAAASVAYRASETIAIFPITPSSAMAELCDEWSSKKLPNLWGAVPDVAEMQSEGGAAGAVHGALQAGSLDELEVIRTLPLSDSAELPLRLRGAAALAGRVHASIAISGGVHTALDVVKSTMAGAHVTQMVSALLRSGPAHLRTVLRDLESWMDEHEWTSLDDMRGNMSLERIPDPAAYERANFRMALR